MVVRIYKIRDFWWSIFPLNYQNAYDYQTVQGDDMLQGALTPTYMTSQQSGLAGSRDKQNRLSLSAEDVLILH